MAQLSKIAGRCSDILIGLFEWATALFRRDKYPARCLVVLLPEPIQMTIHSLIDHLNAEFPDETFHDAEMEGPDDQQSADQSFVVAGFEGPSGEPSFFVKSLAKHHEGLFLVHNTSQLYFNSSSPDNDEQIDELIATHKAWFSIDLLNDVTQPEEALRFLRVMAARIAPADALAVYDTGVGQLKPFDDDVRETLSKGYDVFAP